MLDVLATRRPAVLEHLLCEFNARRRPLVQAIDWDVRWVLGSSSLAGLRGQLATMVWQCRQPPAETASAPLAAGDSGPGGAAAVVFEMDRRQVKDMIVQLEECAADMDCRAVMEEKGDRVAEALSL